VRHAKDPRAIGAERFEPGTDGIGEVAIARRSAGVRNGSQEVGGI
jgi:hypothetical protein